MRTCLSGNPAKRKKNSIVPAVLPKIPALAQACKTPRIRSAGQQRTLLITREGARNQEHSETQAACPTLPQQLDVLGIAYGRLVVNPLRSCGCALCRIEIRLLQDLTDGPTRTYRAVLVSTPRLAQFPTVSRLLAHLRASQVDARSDEIFRDLLTAYSGNQEFVVSFFILAFLPMIHCTIRRIAKQHPALARDDIVQQALNFLVQFLRSAELRARQSHFAFSISRALKRHTFEWAKREDATAGKQDVAAAILNALYQEEPFEQHALLRHFLERCVSKGLIDDQELDLLVQFKLDGNSGEDLGSSAGISSNALRQRMKRLMAKLRRLAQKNGHLR